MNSEKKLYETPTLTIHGSVEDITQAMLVWGTGDYLASAVLAECDDPDNPLCYPSGS